MSTFKERVDKYWADPVWSKVIASIIFAILAAIFVAILGWSQDGTLLNILLGKSIPNWAVALSLVVTFTGSLFFWGGKKQLPLPVLSNPVVNSETNLSLSSQEWFKKIEEKMADAGSVRIYLREFIHPRGFKGEHAGALHDIIEAIRDKLDNNADIRLISYLPKEDGSGIEWLKEQIRDISSLSKVKVIKAQPVANASSMYLFDDRTLIFNRKNSSGFTYHIEDYSSSILHELIRVGYDKVHEETI
ncbi:hypothetical protein N0U25_07620 [Pseudomonas sivasensis]|uniref:hypothetical protein n=1 Tax=Pseudomonas sivasensis TaxID=1880678 RepID=UPI0021AAF5DA|nr:hypothetical protein [Pseudomonas sivasensis]MCT4497657.1 hypothetical protein [Pseudomonas sivasensis]